MLADMDASLYLNKDGLNIMCDGDAVIAKEIYRELKDKKLTYLLLDGTIPVLRKLKLEIETGHSQKKKRFHPALKKIENMMAFTFDTLFYYILPMFSSKKLDKSYCRQLKVSGVFKHEFRYNEPNTDLQYLTPIPNLSYFENTEGKMNLFPKAINELVLLKCTLEEQPQTNILLPPSTLPIVITSTGSYETNVNFEFLLLFDVLNIIKKKYNHIQGKFKDVDIDVYYKNGLEKIHKKELIPSDILNTNNINSKDSLKSSNQNIHKNNNQTDVEVETLESDKVCLLTVPKAEHFRDTINSLFEFIISLDQKKVGSENQIYLFLESKYEKLHWLEDVRNFMNETKQSISVDSINSKLFIAALIELVLSFKIRIYSTKNKIYRGYDHYRKDGALAGSTMSIDIATANKELKTYLKK